MGQIPTGTTQLTFFFFSFFLTYTSSSHLTCRGCSSCFMARLHCQTSFSRALAYSDSIPKACSKYCFYGALFLSKLPADVGAWLVTYVVPVASKVSCSALSPVWRPVRVRQRLCLLVCLPVCLSASVCHDERQLFTPGPSDKNKIPPWPIPVCCKPPEVSSGF